ncbi:MAG TPA: bacillithiol biosynthesis cysteine-adding enzyme BshC [Niabella sp.]|nr:bacillithiol biosynthesis cysteine-adding enzyme BshC [Niabella sp.]HOZ97295.1 bacillithiol biosynthesis cysteine-adding enzyme BshC [Niabella sp.]HQW15434.1 bacillithiol biosynthesis cysteine-adding enzyme BshC [Niabella sp.]HQX20520.1 bacillithiol biosynthesis cysteine-adding enzyme BshC [Niabella sp.]HQX41731.1 bacillithiol biosynthesis cysteine-adding enzyme BshC [Niabella sp.]
MERNKTSIPYAETGYFSKTVLDYLNGVKELESFYSIPPKETQLKSLIDQRLKYATNRNKLAEALIASYGDIEITKQVKENIEKLKLQNTLTITTAHQPNIFTGPLYFIYKILHAIRLSAYCSQKFPEFNFVPVYFMGSEDADLDELGHIFINGEKLEWKTTQTGAVGRMRVDEELLGLIKRIEAEVNVQPYGAEIMNTMRRCYTLGKRIQDATLQLVNDLFGRFGLVVLIPDNPILKTISVDLFKEELLHQSSSKLVEETAKSLTDKGYKAQTHGRDINLFYLMDSSRSRIERDGEVWKVIDSTIRFNQQELLEELKNHPERFSPNVILRGVFQEMILPNIIFIGGGGELAYWLELKAVFNNFQIPYPMLVLRNSFLLIFEEQQSLLSKTGFSEIEVFRNTRSLQNEWIAKNSEKDFKIDKGLSDINKVYEALSLQAGTIDKTLETHVAALNKKATDKLTQLGKKFLRAEKRNHADAMRQIEKLRQQLFPFDSLQERIDNIMPYYSKHGTELIDLLYQHSNTLEQDFVVLSK